MARYQDVKDYAEMISGKSVKICWIAHVKELNGLRPRRAHNRFPGKKRSNPCPPQMKPLIEKAMRHFGWI